MKAMQISRFWLGLPLLVALLFLAPNGALGQEFTIKSATVSVIEKSGTAPEQPVADGTVPHRFSAEIKVSGVGNVYRYMIRTPDGRWESINDEVIDNSTTIPKTEKLNFSIYNDFLGTNGKIAEFSGLHTPLQVDSVKVGLYKESGLVHRVGEEMLYKWNSADWDDKAAPFTEEMAPYRNLLELSSGALDFINVPEIYISMQVYVSRRTGPHKIGMAGLEEKIKVTPKTIFFQTLHGKMSKAEINDTKMKVFSDIKDGENPIYVWSNTAFCYQKENLENDEPLFPTDGSAYAQLEGFSHYGKEYHALLVKNEITGWDAYSAPTQYSVKYSTQSGHGSTLRVTQKANGKEITSGGLVDAGTIIKVEVKGLVKPRTVKSITIHEQGGTTQKLTTSPYEYTVTKNITDITIETETPPVYKIEYTKGADFSVKYISGYIFFANVWTEATQDAVVEPGSDVSKGTVIEFLGTPSAGTNTFTIETDTNSPSTYGPRAGSHKHIVNANIKSITFDAGTPQYSVNFAQPTPPAGYGSIQVIAGGSPIVSGKKVNEGTEIEVLVTGLSDPTEVKSIMIDMGDGKTSKLAAKPYKHTVTQDINNIRIEYGPDKYCVQYDPNPAFSVTYVEGWYFDEIWKKVTNGKNVEVTDQIADGTRIRLSSTNPMPTDKFVITTDAGSELPYTGSEHTHDVTANIKSITFDAGSPPPPTTYTLTYSQPTPADYTLEVRKESKTGDAINADEAVTLDGGTEVYVRVDVTKANHSLEKIIVNGSAINVTDAGSGWYSFKMTADVTSIEAILKDNTPTPPTPTTYTLTYSQPTPADYTLEVRKERKIGDAINADEAVTLDGETEVYVRVDVNKANHSLEKIVVNGGAINVTDAGSGWYSFKMTADVTSIEAILKDNTPTPPTPGVTIVTYEIEHAEITVTCRSGSMEGQEIESGTPVPHNTIIQLTIRNIAPGYRFAIIEVNRRVEAVKENAPLDVGENATYHIKPWIVEELVPGTISQFLTVREATDGVLTVIPAAGGGAVLESGKAYRANAGEKFYVTLTPNDGFELKSSTFDKEEYRLTDEGDKKVFTMPDLSAASTRTLSLFAVFSRRPEYCTVQWDVEDGGTLMVEDSYGNTLESGGTVLKGFGIKISATVNDGYTFKALKVDGTDILRSTERKEQRVERSKLVSSNTIISLEFDRIPEKRKDPDPNPNPPDSTIVSVESVLLSGVAVYPNPMSTHLNVEGVENAASYTLLDLSGRVLLKEKHNGSSSTQLDITNLRSGIYILRVVATDGGERIFRLVK